MQFRTFQPGIEVMGRALGFTTAGFKIMPAAGIGYLSRFGLTSVGPGGKPVLDPDAWYSQEAWLRCFESMQTEIGESTMFEIGKHLGADAPFPRPPRDLVEAMAWIDRGYHAFHRKNGKVMFDPATGAMTEGIGHYGYEAAGDRCIISVCNNPYPCVFDHGVVTGVAQRFQSRASVTHETGAPCRKQGADSCTYVIAW